MNNSCHQTWIKVKSVYCNEVKIFGGSLAQTKPPLSSATASDNRAQYGSQNRHQKYKAGLNHVPAVSGYDSVQFIILYLLVWTTHPVELVGLQS